MLLSLLLTVGDGVPSGPSPAGAHSHPAMHAPSYAYAPFMQPHPPAADHTPLLLLLACGFAALLVYLNQSKSSSSSAPSSAAAAAAPQVVASGVASEVRALQETVKMLIDAQRATAWQAPPANGWANGRHGSASAPRLQVPVNLHTQPTGDESPAAAAEEAAKQLQSPTWNATLGVAQTPGGGVPFELLQEMRHLQDSVKNLERKNRELNRQLTLSEVSNVVDVETKYRLPVPVASEEDGILTQHAVHLSASEIETIRAIFNMFDTEQSGHISTKEIQALHKQLGEPLTDEEARAAAQELDPEGLTTITFNKFLIWWYQSHAQGKKGSAYTQRFKLIHAKLLTANNFDVDKVITSTAGEVYTLEYRLNFYYKGHNQSLKPISPWHDIPLNRIGSGEQGQLFNFVCEIPKWTRAKFECATGELYNPIKQDTQHGKLRYYKHGDMMFNYGFFPQTWEDPDVIPADTGCPGDNDPIDCVEIGATQIPVGAIRAVKVLGLLGLIDDGETDWKLIAISISDPMAHLLNDVDDVEVHLPGAIKAIREYFRDYKSFSGKINTYALKAQAMPRHYAVKVLEETHQHWMQLVARGKRTIGESSHQVDSRKPAVTPLATMASPKITAASPRITATPSSMAAKMPVQELTGMEQPLDKLMNGK